jgi:hypothetical protein
MKTISVQVGRILLEFMSFREWVNHAQSWFGALNMHSTQYICLDNVGRICTCGKQFMQADKEKTYPIRVYAIEQEPQS